MVGYLPQMFWLYRNRFWCFVQIYSVNKLWTAIWLCCSFPYTWSAHRITATTHHNMWHHKGVVFVWSIIQIDRLINLWNVNLKWNMVIDISIIFHKINFDGLSKDFFDIWLEVSRQLFIPKSHRSVSSSLFYSPFHTSTYKKICVFLASSALSASMP